MEKEKYRIIKNVVSGRTTKQRASALLNLSTRQINRLIHKYKIEGKSGFVHGNKNKTSFKKIPSEVESRIITLFKEEYYDFSTSHFNEVLNDEYQIKISYPTLKRILEDNCILSIYAHKKTVRNFKKKLTILKNNKEITPEFEKQLNLLVPFKDARPRKSKPKYAGEVIEMDACDHLWFGDDKTHLHGAIDVATGKITGLYFSKEETLNSYYNVSKQMFLDFGIPAKIKTDKRTIFEYTSSEGKDLEKDTFTQYGYMCKSLGITLTCSSIPESKPHIERLWSTLQKRLIPLLRQANIRCISTANAYVQQYIGTYNSQFSVHDDNITSVYECDTKILESIDKYLSVITFRTVDKGHCIKWANKYYRFEINGEQEYISPKLKVMIISDFNGELYSSIDNSNRLYDLVLVEDYVSYSPEFDDTPVENKIKKTYIPPANHPWRNFKFKSHLSSIDHTTYL